MNWMFIVFLFGIQGPYFGGQPYETKEECEKERVVLVEKIAEHNSKEASKIEVYASACAQVKKAPQGKGV